jgi:muconate cycloisomerase
MAGIEMALWDIAGKAHNCPVSQFFGGKIHDEISYFGFPQGKSPKEIATNAKSFADQGHNVIYIKVGTGITSDIEIIKAVRNAIGPEKRLRVDPNEHWGAFELQQILPQVADCNIECIEQPTHCESISALKQACNRSSIPIAADQLVFTPQDCFDVCKEEAADLIVLGLHETGGIGRFVTCGKIAETARININIHGLYETGITTCATNQAASVLSNLDDGNQYMNHFLKWDIIKGSVLELVRGKMKTVSGVGLGFEINFDNVKWANELYKESISR